MFSGRILRNKLRRSLAYRAASNAERWADEATACAAEMGRVQVQVSETVWVMLGGAEGIERRLARARFLTSLFEALRSKLKNKVAEFQPLYSEDEFSRVYCASQGVEIPATSPHRELLAGPDLLLLILTETAATLSLGKPPRPPAVIRARSLPSVCLTPRLLPIPSARVA